MKTGGSVGTAVGYPRQLPVSDRSGQAFCCTDTGAGRVAEQDGTNLLYADHGEGATTFVHHRYTEHAGSELEFDHRSQ